MILVDEEVVVVVVTPEGVTYKMFSAKSPVVVPVAVTT
jgi:hypothetical protein